MKATIKILMFILLLTWFNSSYGQVQSKSKNHQLKLYDVDNKYDCTNPFMTFLYFTSDSVKGVLGDYTYIPMSENDCKIYVGWMLGKVSNNQIIGILIPDPKKYEYQNVPNPVPYIITMNDSDMELVLNKESTYHCVLINERNVSNRSVMYTTTLANLRESPSSSSKLILKIPQKQPVSILEFGSITTIGNDKGLWTKVIYENQTGWVFGGYLSTFDPSTGE